MNAGGAETLPQLHPLVFIPGCNTPADVTRDQLKINVERDLPWLERGELKDKPLVIVGGGPSLKYLWPEISKHGGDILALNNAYAFLMERDIEPDYFMLLDARRDNVEFLRTPSAKTKHFIAAQCHPDVFDRLEGLDTCLYLTILPETLEMVSHIDKPKVQIAGTVGTVGIKALCMAYALGYRELHLYGYDSSYEEQEHHAFEQKLNDDVNILDVYLDGVEYRTTPTMAQQATEFCSLARGMTQYYGFDINLHCFGLLPDMVAYSNKQGEIPLEQREREKYEKIWTHDIYRKSAPGEMMVEHAIECLGVKEGDSIIDFGCGTGRASAKFRSLGYKVKSIDFAANCVDPGLDLDFSQACLWGLPEMKADYGYCTDVMEHIPMEKVQDVIAGISLRCNAAYFNIATRDDCLGSLIGKRLHMTVMAADGWRQLLAIHWNDIEMIEREGEVTFILKQPRRDYE